MSWREEALCSPGRVPSWAKEGDWFAGFGVNVRGSAKGSTRARERAKAVCRSCPVITDCKQFILSQRKVDRVGVWGGVVYVQQHRDREAAA